MPLANAKHERFCHEYLVDLNAAQAAERTGYAPRRAKQTGGDLMARPEVQARIAQLQAERAARVEVSQDYVLANLTQVLERCMERAPVMVRRGREFVQLEDEDGRDVWQFNAKGALGALKLLGEHLGLYKHVVETRDKTAEEQQQRGADARARLLAEIARRRAAVAPSAEPSPEPSA